MEGDTLMQYHVQDPQGNDRLIEGPDGASDEEVISQAQKLFGQSGGMTPAATASSPNPLTHPISAFRQYLIDSKNPRPTPPQEAFNQDVSGPGLTDTTVADLNTLYAAYKTPEAIGGLYNLGKAGVNGIGNFLKAGKNAEAFVTPESELQAGLATKGEFVSGKAATRETSKTLYEAMPKDMKPTLSNAQSTLDTIANETKGLSPAAQKEAGNLVANYQDFVASGKATLGDIMTEMSRLKAIASDGDGIERMYAARLVKAMQQDVETFGKTNVLQNATGGLTNADIPANLNKANSFYKDMSDLYDHPTSRAIASSRPEQLVDVIFKRGNVDDVNVAKAVTGPAFKSMQNQFYNQLVESKNLSNTLNKYSPEFLDAALGPERVKALQAFAHFKNVMKVGGKAAVATAGATGAYKLYEAVKH